MKRPSRELSIFSLSALDVLAMATGTFVLLMVILMPYYRMSFDANAAIQGALAATDDQAAEADELLRAAAADARAAAELQAEADEIAQAAATAHAAAASLRQDADAADGRAGSDQRRVDEMRAIVEQRVIRELDLVFVIDTTASMGGVLRELALSMGGIVRVLERLVPSLRVGVVAYRDRDLRQWVTRAMPLTPTDRAEAEVLSFVAGLRASNRSGTTVDEDLYAGLVEALAMRFRPGAKQTIIVIGDARAHDQEQQAALIAAERFALGGERRTVSTLFIPTESFRRFGRGDREFFAVLARAGRGEFNDHRGQMIESILLSVLDE